MSWILVKKCIIFFIIIISKNFDMVKIYYGQFGQVILLLIKIYTINLLVKKYIQTVRSENIITEKNLYN
jgi:hypothetical protein